jgi:uncharacterized membrane protein
VTVFDTIGGLPVHPLVVHAVVVLLPLAALATVAVAARPSWRRFSPGLMVLNGAVMVAAFVAIRSGEKLENRIEQFSVPPELATHAEWGKRLFLLSVCLFAGAVVIWLTRNRPALATVVAVVALVGGLVAVGVTVYVGHSGATSVWQDTIKSTRGDDG